MASLYKFKKFCKIALGFVASILSDFSLWSVCNSPIFLFTIWVTFWIIDCTLFSTLFKLFDDRVWIIEFKSGGRAATAPAPLWNPTILLAALATIPRPRGVPPVIKFWAAAAVVGLSLAILDGLSIELTAPVCCL